MTPRSRRFTRALATALAGTALILATVGLNLALGLGPRLSETTPTRLALEALVTALPLAVPLAILAAFSGPWPMRALSILFFAYGWYWLGETLALNHSFNFGNTWAPGEAFAELFWRPLLTPALWGAASLCYFWLIARLNRAPPDLHQGKARAAQ